MKNDCLWQGFRKGSAQYRRVLTLGAAGTLLAARNVRRIAIHFFSDLSGSAFVNVDEEGATFGGFVVGRVDQVFNGVATQDSVIPGRLSITQAEFGNLPSMPWLYAGGSATWLHVVEVFADEYYAGLE